MRITPDHIFKLRDNEIFVFGSNIHGYHAGGAALYACQHFDAEWGVGEGLTGQCYALPTMEGEKSFHGAVDRFIECARQHPELNFLVTRVGCGIAGYSEKTVAQWFTAAKEMENVWLPLGW